MGGENDGASAAGEPGNSLDERSPALDVHAYGRLVEEEDVRIAAHGKSEIQSLLLPAGQLFDEGVRLLFESGNRDRRVTSHGLWVVRAEQVDDFLHLEHVRNARLLQHHAHPAAGLQVGRVEPEQQCLARGRLAQAKEKADRGGFTGAVGSQHRHHLAELDADGDPFKGLDLAVLFGGIDELCCGRHAYTLSTYSWWMASIFTRIIAGELPARFVWEDDDCVAFLSNRPLRPAHALVVPRHEIAPSIDLAPHLLSPPTGVPHPL